MAQPGLDTPTPLAVQLGERLVIHGLHLVTGTNIFNSRNSLVNNGTFEFENVHFFWGGEGGQGYILCILIIPPPRSFKIQFFPPTNKFAAGGAKFIAKKDAFLRPFPPFF